MSDEKNRLYSNSMIAGPMVRGSTLPFRLCCLHHGADLVYSEGITDIPLSKAKRVENDGIIEFYTNSNGKDKCIFKTCPEERGHLVVQIVSNDPNTAVLAAKQVEDIASAIDINCGCPEHWAVHRAAGSAISKDIAVDIVKSLVSNINLPISIKARISQNAEETIQFAKAVEQAGISAFALHGRLPSQQHKGNVDLKLMKTTFEQLHCYTIGNGGITSLESARNMKEETGCNSIMISQAALADPSVFAPQSVPVPQLFREMIDYGKKYDELYSGLKFGLEKIISSTPKYSKAISTELSSSNSYELAEDIYKKICLI